MSDVHILTGAVHAGNILAVSSLPGPAPHSGLVRKKAYMYPDIRVGYGLWLIETEKKIDI